MKSRLVLIAPLLLAGCASDLAEIGREPTMTPVGTGLTSYHAALPTSAFPDQTRREYHSLWTNSREDLFRDSRAMRVGDVVTVEIRIDDQARLNNTTGRSRDSGTNFGLDFGIGIGIGGTNTGGNLGANINSGTSTRGQGRIDRSERIELAVAAVVTNVLPNGNLLVSGSQEVRVNYEMRVLNVAGIVRPRDISARNTIAYDKIAEARISYGGRGRSMEVQQPGWGQQLYDKIIPF
jgi:flagellar L-ring protein precursor FlgH